MRPTSRRVNGINEELPSPFLEGEGKRLGWEKGRQITEIDFKPSLFLLFVAGEELAVLLLHKTDLQHKTAVILVDRFPE